MFHHCLASCHIHKCWPFSQSVPWSPLRHLHVLLSRFESYTQTPPSSQGLKSKHFLLRRAAKNVKSHIEREHHLDKPCARRLRVVLHSFFIFSSQMQPGTSSLVHWLSLHHPRRPGTDNANRVCWHVNGFSLSYSDFFDFSIYFFAQNSHNSLEVCCGTVMAEIFVCDATLYILYFWLIVQNLVAYKIVHIHVYVKNTVLAVQNSVL